MLRRFLRSPLPVVGPIFAALLACSDGGKNENERVVGNEPGGVKLGIGDIAVAPEGGYVLFKGGAKLAVGWPDRGSVVELPVRSPTRLAFSKQRPVVYVGTTSPRHELVAIDVEHSVRLWATAIPDASTTGLRLAVSDDDRFVVTSNASEVRVHVTSTGAVASRHSIPTGVVDVEVLADSTRALVVSDHEWPSGTTVPQTELLIIDLEAGAERRFDVPNCSDDITLSASGARAFLAPTRCRRDPVSVIELEPGSERFVRNLPGFGPVAMAPDGTTAVAFLDARQVDAALFDDTGKIPPSGPDASRYHLMILDSETLAYDFVAVGDELPRYTMTPDGQVLLVDTSWFASDPVRLFDTAARAFRSLSGPAIPLDNFTLASDSEHAYVLNAGVFDIDIAAAVVSSLPVPFVPQNINISADDLSLYLRRNTHDVCVFELSSKRCVRDLHFEAPAVEPTGS